MPSKWSRALKLKYGIPYVYYAEVVERANEAPAATRSLEPSLRMHILARIRRCLKVAYDQGRREDEARIALRMSCRLMNELNITKAELLAHEDSDGREKHGGHSIVVLKRRDSNTFKRPWKAHYLLWLQNAITVFFDCKFYTCVKKTLFIQYSLLWHRREHDRGS